MHAHMKNFELIQRSSPIFDADRAVLQNQMYPSNGGEYGEKKT